MEALFSGQVGKVRASSRLTDSAVVLVDDDAGITSNMERILRQAQQFAPAARRVLELNPRHPLIHSLAELQKRGDTAEAEPIARLLLDDALLLEGSVKEPAAMAKRIQEMLAKMASQAVSRQPSAVSPDEAVSGQPSAVSSDEGGASEGSNG
jgi:molecular chaperone HtpG